MLKRRLGEGGGGGFSFGFLKGQDNKGRTGHLPEEEEETKREEAPNKKGRLFAYALKGSPSVFSSHKVRDAFRPSPSLL